MIFETGLLNISDPKREKINVRCKARFPALRFAAIFCGRLLILIEISQLLPAVYFSASQKPAAKRRVVNSA